MKQQESIIIYNTADGKISVTLYEKNGDIWMNQNQIAELFDTSIPNISMHIKNIVKEGELSQESEILEQERKDFIKNGETFSVSAVIMIKLTKLHRCFLQKHKINSCMLLLEKQPQKPL